MVSIYIRVSTGEKVNVNVDLNSSIQELKNRIGGLRSVDPELITFVFKGKILKDECLLEACGGCCLTGLTSRDYGGKHYSHGHHEEEERKHSKWHTYCTREGRIVDSEEGRAEGCRMELNGCPDSEEHSGCLCTLVIKRDQYYQQCCPDLYQHAFQPLRQFPLRLVFAEK